MNFNEVGDFVTQHALPLLGAGWAASMVVGGAIYVAPHLRPKRPIVHGKNYLEAEAKANAEMAKLGLE
jgi:hypothetical protein